MKRFWKDHRKKNFILSLIISYDEIQRKPKKEKKFDIFN
jgi:hypothetical protein